MMLRSLPPLAGGGPGWGETDASSQHNMFWGDSPVLDGDPFSGLLRATAEKRFLTAADFPQQAFFSQPHSESFCFEKAGSSSAGAV